MKKNYLLLTVLLLLSPSLWAKEVLISNPVYEVNTSGIREIEKIVLTDTNTEIHMNTPFLPNWWVAFNENTHIEDAETLEKFKIESIIGAEIGEKVFMPASGDSTFVLLFPPLTKTTKSINYYEGNQLIMQGISLDPKAIKKDKSKVPAQVSKWIEEELAKAKRKELIDYNNPNEFFTTDKVRIVGYIKGYSPKLNFKSGLIYYDNIFNAEQMVNLIDIKPDGRFEVEFPIHHPTMELFIRMNEKNITSLYLEPGQTLALVLDWEEFRLADRYRDRRYKMVNEFYGPLAQVNERTVSLIAELSDSYISHLDSKVYKRTDQGAANLQSLEEILPYMAEQYKKVEDKKNEIIANNKLTNLEKTLIEYSFVLMEPYDLLSYKMGFRDWENPTNEIVVPENYYSSLANIPFSDHKLLMANNISSFINRLEYETPLFKEVQRALSQKLKVIDFYDYLFDELKIEPTPLDEAYLELSKTFYDAEGNFDMNIITELAKTDTAIITRYVDASNAMIKRYPEQMKGYEEKYLNRYSKAEKFEVQKIIQDSLLYDLTKHEPNVITGILSLNSFDRFLMDATEEESLYVIDVIYKDLPYPSVKEYLMQKHTTVFTPLSKEDIKPKATAFVDILDQYKGKYVIVDVWASWCGPCRSGITQSKKIRAEYENHPELAFVFVSKEKLDNKYIQYCKDNGMTNNHILEDEAYREFSAEFNITGIPRYMLFDKEGNVLNSKFVMYNIEHELEKLNLTPVQK